MSLEIVVKLNEQDLEHFRSAMRKIYSAKSDLDDETIINHARETIREIRLSDAPEYIQKRIGNLEALIGLLTNSYWKIPPGDRPRVLEALAYFTEVHDLIPDELPGLGYLDDAFMIDIACQDFKDELEAYRDFCVHRVVEEQQNGRDISKAEAEEWLEHRRKQVNLKKYLSTKQSQF
ncbi:MAG: DUF1232 domain-containing protein [Lysobacterales bacterium]|jgi:uncharacterized membrane protein YkvA (DUF1232 family)